jgi:phosphoribosylaminoimidazole carboxylase
MRKNGRILGW